MQRGKKNPVWIGRYREDEIAHDGSVRRRQRSINLGSVRELGKREAWRLLFEKLGGANQGQKPQLSETFEQFTLERWEPNIFPALRRSTAINYRTIIRKHLLPFFGEMRLAEITGADVQAFLSQKIKQGLSPRSLLSLRNRLSKIFGSAKLWGWLPSNPAQGAQIPSISDVREKRALTPEQVAALAAELAEPYRSMALLAVLSGMRRGEIFGLRWKYIDWTEGSITVAECFSAQAKFSAPKTRASRRKVFVEGAGLDMLAKLRPGSADPNALVFASASGRPFNPENVRNRILLPACRRAGIPEIGWHTFRYTYTTWANPTGESIKAVQAQLGHRDARLTLNVYTQPQPEAQRRIAHKVAAELSAVLLPDAPNFAAMSYNRDGNSLKLVPWKEVG